MAQSQGSQPNAATPAPAQQGGTTPQDAPAQQQATQPAAATVFRDYASI